MDQAALVGRDQIDDGFKLVEQLVQNHFDVVAAFWLKDSEEGQQFLYIASKSVDEHGKNKAYRDVHHAMQQLPALSLDYFDVKLISPSDPLAKAVLDLYARYPAKIPTWIRGQRLGDVTVEEAYVYPPLQPAAPAP
jgi:hypothetical protein